MNYGIYEKGLLRAIIDAGQARKWGGDEWTAVGLITASRRGEIRPITVEDTAVEENRTVEDTGRCGVKVREV